jgi:plasmid stabilization system protein ParE
MAYTVNFTPRAERDLLNLLLKINAEQSDRALEWYRRLHDAIMSLQNMPHRCPTTRENQGVRHLLHGNKPHIYRIIYRILEKQQCVEILHVRHGARRDFRASDIA